MRKPLPKIGSIHQQWVRCGRSTCRCARGELHGPYWYLFWREDGRPRKRYIKPDEVEAMRAALAEACHERRRWRHTVDTARQRFQTLLAGVREAEQDG